MILKDIFKFQRKKYKLDTSLDPNSSCLRCKTCTGSAESFQYYTEEYPL